MRASGKGPCCAYRRTYGSTGPWPGSMGEGGGQPHDRDAVPAAGERTGSQRHVPGYCLGSGAVPGSRSARDGSWGNWTAQATTAPRLRWTRSGAMWDGSRSAWWESARPAGGSAATGSGDMRIRVANRRRRVLCGLHRRPLLPRPRPATAPSRPSHCRPARRVSCLLRVGLVIGACPPFVSTGTAAGFGHPGPEPGWVEPRAGRCLAPPGGELGLYSTQVRGPDPLSYAFSQLGSML